VSRNTDRHVGAARGSPRCSVFLSRFGVGRLAKEPPPGPLSALDLLLEFLDLLLGNQSALFLTLAAVLEVVAVDLLRAILEFARGGFGLPLVATARQVGDEDARRRTEVAGGGPVHVLIFLAGCAAKRLSYDYK
jgi:hypothetical protein